jgi:hypothetical protein
MLGIGGVIVWRRRLLFVVGEKGWKVDGLVEGAKGKSLPGMSRSRLRHYSMRCSHVQRFFIGLS